MILRDEEKVCRILAPELPPAFYVLNSPPGLPQHPDVSAYALTAPCAILKKLLVEIGEYRGEGPAIIFCGAYGRHDGRGILLHELAHPLPYLAADYLPSREFNSEAIAAFEANPSGRLENKPGWWPSHDGNFIRRALHLWWRAAMVGYFTPLETMHICGRDYDTAPVGMYFDALGSEAVEMQHKTFSEIAAVPAPKAFRELWSEDIADWGRMQLYHKKTHAQITEIKNATII